MSWLTWSAQQSGRSVDDQGNVVTTEAITGGTGRFAGAHGETDHNVARRSPGFGHHDRGALEMTIHIKEGLA